MWYNYINLHSKADESQLTGNLPHKTTENIREENYKLKLMVRNHVSYNLHVCYGWVNLQFHQTFNIMK